jgi:tetratricopeptide (TPR) repeat protein
MPKRSLSEDELLRMLVTAITETVARLTHLRTTGNYEQSLEVIDEDLEELLGLKANLVRQFDDRQIVDMLTVNEYLDVERLYYVAVLFRLEGEIYSDQGQANLARNSQIRALNLFVEVGFAVENDFLEADDYIDELFDALGEEAPEDTLYTLFDYYEQVGAYDRAETAINLMLQTTENNPDILAQKCAFYGRLLDESNAELEEGGVTREGIERSLSALK